MLIQIVLAFLLLGWWESANPYVARSFDQVEVRRQTTNILMLLSNTIFIYVISLLFVWRLASLQLHFLVDISSLPIVLSAVIGILLLDFGSYLRHRMMHWRWFWLVHRVHHSDEQMNWTTEFRFHPIEVLVGLIIQSCVVLLFGIPPLALALFALLGLGVGCWQHANISTPTWLDKATAWLLVTPGLHRVHHQVDTEMQGSNYGVLVPWWDQLMGTYRRPNAGKQFGLLGVQELDVHSLWQLLVIPFRRIKSS